MDPTPEGGQLLRALLPRWYDVADASGGGALGALLDVLGAAFEEHRHEVGALYDQLFVETCDDWLLPYFGEQVGVRGFPPAATPGFNARAWVGEVTALRRRKGTLAALTTIARAASGFPVVARTGAGAVGMTWSAALPAVRPVGRPSACVSGRPAYARHDGTALAVGRGAFPLPGVVELTVWRLAGQPVTGRTAAAVGGTAYTFDPLGVDTPLFEYVDTGDPSWPAPQQLTRRALTAYLAAGAPPPFRVADAAGPVPPDKVVAGDLHEWRPARHGRHRLVVDPELGRLLFTRPPRPPVTVDYTYGSVADVGGGPYPRRGDVLHRADLPHLVTVGQTGAADYRRLGAALGHAQHAAAEGCRVRVDDSATYEPVGGGWRVFVPSHGRLRIESAPGAAPALAGALTVYLDGDATLELAGLTFGGPVHVAGRGVVAVTCCTLVPHPLVLDGAQLLLAGSVDASLLGPVHAGRQVRLAVRDSVVDGGLGRTGAPVPVLTAERVTVLGRTTADVLVADTCLFDGDVTVTEPRAGVVRFSAVTTTSTTPARVQCVHDRPLFTSIRYGNPAYCQLDDRAPPELRTGGADGGELGAFAQVAAGQRLRQLASVLADFVPAGSGVSVRAAT